jgi:SCY1-like protein 2
MKDSYLIPFILPLVFEITKSLQKEEFGPVLNKLQPLFAMKDPPQIMMSECGRLQKQCRLGLAG